MQLFPLEVSVLSKVEKHNSRRLPAQGSPAGAIVCLAALISLGFAAALTRPITSEEPVFWSDPLLQEIKVADMAGGAGAQIAVSGHTFAINSRAFNSMREKEIAKDTAKLLKLAIALKTEVDSSSSSDASADALAKANEIEKLAKHVKTKMAINPTEPLY